MYKVLVADDEKDVLSLLKDYFEMNDYFVITASTGKEAIEKASQAPDIILLDVNMPDGDGLTVCRKIRNFVSCPILFLTAKIEESDKIKGFSAGGDDYIVKPFSIEELGARVSAHIRRDHRISKKTNTRFFGGISIDYTGKAVYAGDTEIGFAKKEFQIIELLSVNCGQIFDKELIYEKIWGYDAEGESSVVAEHIRRIRSKLSEFNEEYHIETVWGMGYKWIKERKNR